MTNLLVFTSLALYGILIHFIAWKKGAFSLPKKVTPVKLRFKDALSIFLIYIVMSFGVVPVSFLFLKPLFPSLYSSYMTRIAIYHILNYSCLLLSLGSFLYLKRGTLPLRQIWQNKRGKPFTIFKWGMLTYLLAFPFPFVASKVTDSLLAYLVNYKEIDQLAVQYLKQSLPSLPHMLLTFSTVMIFAPVIEEFIFRGILQTWLRKRLGQKGAILCTALCFGLFHYSPPQGLSNLPIIVTLSVFSIYLGFLYEKFQSLLAPIALHMTFNGISVLFLLLLNR